MSTQSDISVPPELHTAMNIMLIAIGVIAGGVVSLITLWLWFNYQLDPDGSMLHIISSNFAGVLPSSMQLFLEEQAVVMGLPLAKQSSAYWYMARAGGIMAYLLLWISTIWGLTLSTKLLAGWFSPVKAYGYHEFLSLLAIVFSGLHVAVLLGDEYIKFNIFHLAIPFTAPYRPIWTGLGTVSLYLIMGITASFYVRNLIGQTTWRYLHYLTFVAYLLVLGHSIMAGTDSSLTGMKLFYWGTGFSILFLVFYRMLTLKVGRRNQKRAPKTIFNQPQ